MGRTALGRIAGIVTGGLGVVKGFLCVFFDFAGQLKHAPAHERGTLDSGCHRSGSGCARLTDCGRGGWGGLRLPPSLRLMVSAIYEIPAVLFVCRAAHRRLIPRREAPSFPQAFKRESRVFCFWSIPHRFNIKTLDSVSVRNIVATLPYSSTARNDGPGHFPTARNDRPSPRRGRSSIARHDRPRLSPTPSITPQAYRGIS